MADTRVDINIVGVGLGGSATLFESVEDPSMAAEADGMKFENTGREILFVSNESGGAITVTVTSVAEPSFGRTGDIAAASLADHGIMLIGALRPQGWTQDGTVVDTTAGTVIVSVSAETDVKIAAVQFTA